MPPEITPKSRPWFPLTDTSACCEPEPLIEVDNLSLSYHDKLAFRGFTLSINRGCITALVGPSGCGKTSFLMTLNRLTDLIPGCRVTGRIRLDRDDILAPNNDVVHLRRRVGMIFQKPSPFPLSIRRNLAFPLKEHGVRDRRQIERVIKETLQAVGLWEEVKDRLDTPALTLSGGQQQRLCFARALALRPEVLLLDEPCSALDPISGGLVEDLIAELRGQYTIVIVTHNLAQARRLADYMAFFWVQDGAGTLIETGDAHQMFDHPQDELTRAYVAGLRG